MASWLAEMVKPYSFIAKGHGQYQCVFRDDLPGHPNAAPRNIMKRATTGSILIPLLAQSVNQRSR